LFLRIQYNFTRKFTKVSQKEDQVDLFQLSELNNSQILSSAGILIIFLLVLLQKSIGCKESDGNFGGIHFQEFKKDLACINRTQILSTGYYPKKGR